MIPEAAFRFTQEDACDSSVMVVARPIVTGISCIGSAEALDASTVVFNVVLAFMPRLKSVLREDL